MIELRGVCRSYGQQEVLRGVDLDVGQSEFVAVVGRSGCGKTTLLNVIGGLDTDYKGRVEVAGVTLRELSDRALSSFRNRAVGFLFQTFQLIDDLTCVENAALPALFTRQGGEESVRDRALELLEQVGLLDKAEARPTTLSGGEKQRLALARSLFNRPRILLCDELTGNLDETTGKAVLGMLCDLRRRHGITLVIVTHDDRIAGLADRAMCLDNGVLLAVGSQQRGAPA